MANRPQEASEILNNVAKDIDERTKAEDDLFTEFGVEDESAR